MPVCTTFDYQILIQNPPRWENFAFFFSAGFDFSEPWDLHKIIRYWLHQKNLKVKINMFAFFLHFFSTGSMGLFWIFQNLEICIKDYSILVAREDFESQMHLWSPLMVSFNQKIFTIFTPSIWGEKICKSPGHGQVWFQRSWNLIFVGRFLALYVTIRGKSPTWTVLIQLFPMYNCIISML